MSRSVSYGILKVYERKIIALKELGTVLEAVLHITIHSAVELLVARSVILRKSTVSCKRNRNDVFDNMTPQEVQDTLNALEEKDLRKDVLIEISGGITEDNILDYAPLDVDIISLGSITHQASSLNFSLDMD